MYVRRNINEFKHFKPQNFKQTPLKTILVLWFLFIFCYVVILFPVCGKSLERSCFAVIGQFYEFGRVGIKRGYGCGYGWRIRMRMRKYG